MWDRGPGSSARSGAAAHPGFNEPITRDQVIERASSSPPEYQAYRYNTILD
ncbi:hypothetical protein IOE58_07115 [Brachybacterium sp. Marseille-Q2903]|uniref:Uncharacterized protein n=1 Tax=Brachybacterium epidermidis TaxID=2781983 RepID=A0ABR9W3G4_9MICO|nr:hypothetical protein [Brachybacterium epidermidis]MBE9403965.1 hypothetical protein [Brachybacterium epidermidis]